MYVYLLSFLLLVSCYKGHENIFYSETSKRWIAGASIEKINENYESLELIERPRGTLQPILRINFYDASFNKVSDCLFYRVPQSDDGEVLIIQNPKNLKCMDIIDTKAYVKLENIRNFGVEIKEKGFTLKVDKLKYDYDLLNTPLPKRGDILESSVDSEFLIASIIDYKTQTKLLRDGTVCFDIDDECKTLVENQCENCLGGSYKVISSKCATKVKKVCGIDHCGKKGEVACLRGISTSKLDMKNYCINDSPVGFCNKGLRVICLNSTLYCE